MNEASRTITVLPKVQVFQGDVDITYVGGGTLTPGGTTVLEFTATSTGSPAVTVSLSALASTGWSGIQIVDTQTPPQPIPNGQIAIPALGQVSFGVSVPIPVGTSGTNFTLTVEATGPNVQSSRTKQLTVGQAAPTEDTTIAFNLRGIDGGTQAGSSISVARAATAELTVEVGFTQPGNYDVTVVLEPGTPQWALATDVPPAAPGPSFVIGAGDIHGGVATRTFLVDLTPTATATVQPNLHITGNHAGAVLTSDLLYQLLLAS